MPRRPHLAPGSSAGYCAVRPAPAATLTATTHVPTAPRLRNGTSRDHAPGPALKPTRRRGCSLQGWAIGGGRTNSVKGEGAAKGARSDSTRALCRVCRCGLLSADPSRCTRIQGVPAGGVRARGQGATPGGGARRREVPGGAYRGAASGPRRPAARRPPPAGSADPRGCVQPRVRAAQGRAAAPGCAPQCLPRAGGRAGSGGQANDGEGPERAGPGWGGNGDEIALLRSPSSSAHSSSCLRARGSSWRRWAGVPEHSARARPRSTPCAASIRSKRPIAEPSSSTVATRTAPCTWVSACPLSQSRAPPVGGRGGFSRGVPHADPYVARGSLSAWLTAHRAE